MLRPIACLSVLSLLIFCRSYSQEIYYNLKGKKISPKEEKGLRKIIVLTPYLREDSIHKAIKDHMIIDCPSNEVIDSMNRAYTLMHESHGSEQGFIVGKKGMISFMMHGNRDSISSGEILRASTDLQAKGDSRAYQVHTHGDSLDEKIEPYFAITPSDTDRHARYFPSTQQADVILSYDWQPHRVDTATSNPDRVPFDGDGEKKVTYTYRYSRVIVFYRETGKLKKLPFREFKRIVEKIIRDN